jgi:hypothetical protein
MATTTTPTTPKVKKVRVEVPMAKRIDVQVTRAVLAGKMNNDELKALADRLSRLHAFVSVE